MINTSINAPIPWQVYLGQIQQALTARQFASFQQAFHSPDFDPQKKIDPLQRAQLCFSLAQSTPNDVSKVVADGDRKPPARKKQKISEESVSMDDLQSNDSAWQPDGGQYDGEDQEHDMEAEEEYEEEEVVEEEEEEDDDADESRFHEDVLQVDAVPRGQPKRNAPNKKALGKRSPSNVVKYERPHSRGYTNVERSQSGGQQVERTNRSHRPSQAGQGGVQRGRPQSNQFARHGGQVVAWSARAPTNQSGRTSSPRGQRRSNSNAKKRSRPYNE